LDHFGGVAAPKKRYEGQRACLAALERSLHVDLPQSHYLIAPLVGQPVADVMAVGILRPVIRTRQKINDGREHRAVVVEDEAGVVLEAAPGHIGIRSRLELQAAIPDGSVALEAKHAVDSAIPRIALPTRRQ
jgi:hypothetical protein